MAFVKGRVDSGRPTKRTDVGMDLSDTAEATSRLHERFPGFQVTLPSSGTLAVIATVMGQDTYFTPLGPMIEI